MNYEQKYKEALEAATRIYNAPSVKITTQKLLEQVFPELKESEDERIRKWLYDYISNCPNNNFAFYGGVGKDAVLNYLEKQKEQNYIPSREMILGIWELGNFWKENPEARDGLTQLQYIQKYWNENSYY